MNELNRIEEHIIQYRRKGNKYGLPVFARKVKAVSFNDALMSSYRDYPELLSGGLTWYDMTSESGWHTSLEETREQNRGKIF